MPDDWFAANAPKPGGDDWFAQNAKAASAPASPPASEAMPPNSIVGGFGRRLKATGKGLASLLTTPAETPSPTEVGVDAATGGIYSTAKALSELPGRTALGMWDASKEALGQAEQQLEDARSIPSGNGNNLIKALTYGRAAATGLSALDPLASASAVNVNRLEDEGRGSEALGQGAADAVLAVAGSEPVMKGVGRFLPKRVGPKPFVGEEIGGEKFPKTAGQTSGKPGGFTQTVEHYAQRSFLGGPLKKVKAAQEASARAVMAKLSKSSLADPDDMARSWEGAREETRIAGDDLYKSIQDAPANDVPEIAQSILAQDEVRLPSKVRAALEKAAGRGTSPESKLLDDVAKGQGYKNYGDAVARDSNFPDLVKRLGIKVEPPKITLREALDARRELGEAAKGTRDMNDARLLKEARARLDAAMEKNLTPEQLAVKQNADLLWRRSYIMDDVQNALQDMQSSQSPAGPTNLLVDPFVKLVNDLTHKPLSHFEGNLVHRPSQIEVLFDNPADRTAMVQLADFMKKTYGTMGGKSGIGEQIGQIGLALDALEAGRQAISLHPAGALAAAAPLATLYGLSKLMADPGGAALLLRYFRAPANVRPAMAAQVAGAIAGEGQAFQHTAVNGQGHRIGSHDGETWFDHDTGARVETGTNGTEGPVQ